jgi:DNA invertase Pin-like site-specific DNA recombinase
MAPSLFVLRAGERLVPSLDAQVTGIADNLRFHHAKSGRTKLRTFTYQAGPANQERELRAVADRMGCDIVHVYRDHGVSGAQGRDKRPQFDRLCRDATKRQFDMVMAWSVDRLGRSLQDLVGFLSEIHALKINLYVHQQGIDTTTPAGKTMFQMMGVFAEFERSMIQERVRAGLARAVAEGTKLGRPKTDAATEKAIRDALRKGDAGMQKIAARFGVGTGTVQRIKAGMAAPAR